MWRSILFIKTAIQVSNPAMPDATAEAYAKVIQPEAKKRNFDPVTIVAIVENESHWRSNLVGGLNNQCIGLGQHCLHIYAYCRDTNYLGEKCQARKAHLLNGGNNLMATAQAITSWRKYCTKLTGKPALFHRWLYGYQGHAMNDPSRQCGMKKTKRGWVDIKKPGLVQRVMRRRVEIIRATERSLRKRKKRG